MIDTLNEKHYSIKEIAQHLRISRQSAIRMVRNEARVLKFKLGKKKAHTLYVVPESVLRRIYNRMLG